MFKLQMTTILRIESETAKTWRIVERETTSIGLRRGQMPVRASGLTEDQAWADFRRMKISTLP